MPQRDRFDKEIVSLIKSGKIEVDSQNGFVYGSNSDITGQRKKVGFLNKDGDHLFSSRWEKTCFQYYVCRAIWLSSEKIMPDMIVNHKNENKNDNRLINLVLVKYEGRRFVPYSWSESELKWLEKSYSTKSLSQLADKCGRSIKAVRHKIKLIGLPPKRGQHKKWLKSEEDLLIKMYKQKKSIPEIAKVICRTEDAVRLHAGKLGMFRSDRQLQTHFRSSDFYNAMKKTLGRKTTKSKCCLCGYSKYVELHHLDGNNKNHLMNNIASLCSNCHNEVEHGEHQNKILYCIWWRVYSDGSLSKKMSNKTEIIERME